jgi:hypothetical protein
VSIALPLLDDVEPRTLTDQLAEFFRRRPGQWIDGVVLAQIAGRYAWRSRVSELRRPPYSMRVQNRQRHVRAGDMAKWTVSEYRYLPEAR